MPGSASIGWIGNTGWTLSKTITIDRTKCGTAESYDFPMLFMGTYSYLATVANGGNAQNGSGYDIIFMQGTTVLKWEQELYNPTTGQVLYWIKVPRVSVSVDTVITMYIGNASIASFQGGTAASVWTNGFKAVYHFGDGTTLLTADSTGVNNGINNGATATPGKVYGAASFNGSSGYINCGNNASLNITALLTVSCWANVTVFPGVGTFGCIIVKGYDGSDLAYDMDFYNDGVNNIVQLASYNGGSGGAAYNIVGTPTGSWKYYSAKYLGGGIWKMFVNGADVGSIVGALPPLSNAVAVYIGAAHIISGPARYLNGMIDQARIMNVATSASWTLTEYNNQNDPSTFYTIT